MQNRKNRLIGMIILIAVVSLLTFRIATYLPTIGDHNTPANSYISQYFIENAVKDTHAYNIVTAVLADYRGFDTLFETCVMFLSGITAMMILSTKEKVKREKKTLFASTFQSDVMDSAFRLIIPIVLIYGMYVLIHGEISLGGGFQAGALIACAYMLERIIPGMRSAVDFVREDIALLFAGIGVFIYLFTGLLPMFNGGNFLEYGKLPFGEHTVETVAHLHTTGILMIEIGVTVCVAFVIIAILDIVLERTDFHD